MKEILLTSETFVKNVTAISDNVAGKYLLPSMREAQEIHLQGILGTCLYDDVKSIVEQGKVAEMPYYRALLDRCQYYLAYMAVVELLDKISFKICNFGVVKTSDENVESASYDDITRQKDLYRAKADHQAFILQGWLLDNRVQFPKLTECDCERIHSNLFSSASCGIWLGGERGKRERR